MRELKREFLMLARDYDPKVVVAGWYASEKLDGLRCFYDGGISRGVPASEVPWANTTKHERYKEPPIATGLWTRYGQPLQAPDLWLDCLPTGMMLDGELWGGRGNFQKVTSCCKKLVPDDNWWDVKYMVFDRPAFNSVFKSSMIDNANMKKELIFTDCFLFSSKQWLRKRWPQSRTEIFYAPPSDFLNTYRDLLTANIANDVVQVHEQIKLPNDIPTTRDTLRRMLDSVLEKGGEGLMLRRPVSQWESCRSKNLLKVKAELDMEVTVIGYNWGEETDRGSKLLGKMGSAICRMDSGKIFALSGFTEAEREMSIEASNIIQDEDLREGYKNPGQSVSICWYNPQFPRGSRITIKYRELTEDGKPKEARYWRKHE